MKKHKEYSTMRFRIGLFSAIACLGPIIYILANEYNKCMYGEIQETTCTPSQEHQQLTEQLNEISADMNILLQLSEISPKCYLDDNTGYGLTNIPCE